MSHSYTIHVQLSSVPHFRYGDIGSLFLLSCG